MPARALPVWSPARPPDSRQVADIIFLIEYPFARWDYDRFGIDALRSAGFTVEVWNLALVLWGHTAQEIAVSDPATYDGYRQFRTKREVVAAIHSVGRASMAVCFITYTLESFPVFRALSKAGIPYVVGSNNALPPRKRSAHRRLGIVRKLHPRRLAEAAFRRLPCERLGVQSAALLLAGGARSCDISKPVARRSRVIWLHAWDYDAYLRARATPSGAHGRLGVFLDEFYPYHADYVLDRMAAPITAEEYYPLVRGFFDYLETRYAGRIAVAAHPRSRYEALPDCYGGREVIRARTAELVRDARFVLAHSSTSINFAVLFRKPLIFMTCKTLQPTPWGDAIETVASALGKKPVELGAPPAEDVDRELVVDEATYAAYQHNYIKKNGTPELPFWEQFIDQVRHL